MARILVIDDDALLRNTVRMMLESGGHDAVLASDPDDGVHRFQQETFDVIICDVFMPTKERGLETIAALRRISATVPIISMTGSYPRSSGGAHLDPEFLRMAREFSATQVIGKPFRARDLLAAVKECLASLAALSLIHCGGWG